MIWMLDGAVRQGRAEPFGKDGVAVSGDTGPNTQEPLYFESIDGGEPSLIAADRVKAVYVGGGSDADPNGGVRFFDAAPLPASLWVRIGFADGEVLEGMIANAWSAFGGAMLELELPGQRSERKRVLIPRTSITEFQVITTR